MLKILSLLALLVSPIAQADAPVIWNGTTAKWLPSGLQAAGLCKMSSTGVQTVYTTDGLVKMSSGVPGAAVSGTDFAPATSGSSVLSGNGSGGFTNNTSTGSGNVVFSSAPTLTNPVVGTQSPLDNSTKAASTAYVDAAVIAESPAKDAVNFSTTAALPTVVYANGSSGVGATLTGVALAAISTDGGSPTVGQRILVKNQVSTFQNGIYSVTQTGSGIAVFILTRTIDYDQSVEAQSGSSVFVISGTINAGTVWDQNSASAPVMGTDAITFAQTAGPGSTTIGSLDANAVNAQGLSFNGSVLSAQSADATHPGMVNTTTQTFGGVKTLTSPVLVTPTIGAALATSINGMGISCVSGTCTFSLAASKTFTVSNTLTFTGTDTSSVAFGTGGTVAYTANNLSVFAATTSLQLLGVISDETGSGSLVFASAPTLTNPIVGTQSPGDNSTLAASTAFVTAAVAGAGGGCVEPTLTKTSSYQIVSGDFTCANKALQVEMNCASPCTLTLPLASNSGFVVDAVNVGDATATVATIPGNTLGRTQETTLTLIPTGEFPQNGQTLKASGGSRWNGY